MEMDNEVIVNRVYKMCPRLRGFCQVKLLNKSLIDDVIQLTLIEVNKYGHKFNGKTDAKLYSWTKKICLRVISKVLKKEAKHNDNRISSSWIQNLPSNHLMPAEAEEMISEIVSHLTPVERWILDNVFDKGVTKGRAAEVLGIPYYKLNLAIESLNRKVDNIISDLPLGG